MISLYSYLYALELIFYDIIADVDTRIQLG